MMEEIIQAIKKTKTEIGNKEVEYEWREFLLSEIFDIQHGNNFDKNKMTFNNPKINFISRTRENNGFLCKVDLITTIKPYKSGLITMSLIGEGRGACFIQNDPFYTTQNMLVLNPKSNLITDNVKLFLIQRITYTARNIYDAYTNTLHGNIDKFLFKLPSNNNQPDFEMMEKIIDNLKKQSKLDKIEKLKEKLKNDIRQLDTSNWEEVSLINEGAGKEIMLKLKEGNTNLVSSTENNNGVSKRVSGYKKLFDGNKLTLAKNGSVGCVFYQAEPFCATSDVVVLSHPKLTKNSALFIKTILEKQTKNFDYNNKINNTKLNKIMLKLPSFEFMEKFIDEIRI